MQCPGCQFEDGDGAKFCKDCGHDLSLSSEPACKELSFAEKLGQIQKFCVELTEKTLATLS